MFLLEVAKAFKEEKIPYAIVGGLALALHGIVRSTVDIDLVIHLSENHLKSAEKALQSLGLQSRIPVRAQDVFQFRDEYINQRNLIAWSFADFKRPLREIDILITLSTTDLEIDLISVAGVKIPVASLGSLLKMKQAAGRPQDLVDIPRIQEALNAQKKR